MCVCVWVGLRKDRGRGQEKKQKQKKRRGRGRKKGEPETEVNDSEGALAGLSNEPQLLCKQTHTHAPFYNKFNSIYYCIFANKPRNVDWKQIFHNSRMQNKE